jgi:predicted 2-oxoglutarate/Fe(II)-dependent dioxygenase YbiX
MSLITTELAERLSTVQRPGDFYATGTTELFAPHLEVEGIGPIALPLLPVQAEQLIAVAERAPYGRGEDTLVDTEVRRTWQIDAERIRIEGRNWARTLETIVARAAEGLGVTEPVVAELYKLLVYDEGSFFVSHRDTEKAPGMFATLVIVLPSLYTGGEFLVRHRDREVRLDLRCPEPSEVAFAAFYADCVHEVLPITSGCRLTLIYNLLRRGQGRLPEPPSYDTEQARVTALLQQWVAGKELPDDDSPEKLIYPLEHAYTQAELAFAALKGADAAVAAVLVAAAPRADCDLHLALVSIEESGSAEHTYYGSGRRRWSDEEDDDYEVIEVDDRSATLADWQRPDGSRPELGVFPFEEEELCPPDAFADLEPDEQHFHEATGNEGASFERTYRRAALVLWPRGRRLAVLNQASLPVTLPYLGELTRRWAESGEGPESPWWREAHDLSGHMLRTWPRPVVSWYSGPTKSPSNAGEMLTLLSRLKDTARIDAFLADLSATGVYGKGDNEALVRAVGLLPSPRAADLIERIIAGNAAADLSACGDLLARSAAAARITGRTADLSRAATVLVKALPGDPAQAPKTEPGRRPLPVEPGFVVDLLTALGHIDAALADRAADYLLAWPKTYGPDAVLVPAVLALTGQAASRDWGAVQRLRAACLEHLRVRIAEPLEPPRDWVRASNIACRCPHCSELSRFLADPDRKSWTFKAAESGRRHVEDSVRRSGCDLDLATDRRGRPYSLVCTKNQASYLRRAQQRKKDLEELARLEVSPG